MATRLQWNISSSIPVNGPGNPSTVLQYPLTVPGKSTAVVMRYHGTRCGYFVHQPTSELPCIRLNNCVLENTSTVMGKSPSPSDGCSDRHAMWTLASNDLADVVSVICRCSRKGLLDLHPHGLFAQTKMRRLWRWLCLLVTHRGFKMPTAMLFLSVCSLSLYRKSVHGSLYSCEGES